MKYLLFIIILFSALTACAQTNFADLPVKSTSSSADERTVVSGGATYRMSTSVLQSDLYDSLNAHLDTLQAIRPDVNANSDSLAVHLDTLQAHNTRILAAGGGSYTFENGLTEAAGTVKLGGDLTENTDFKGGGSYDFNVGILANTVDEFTVLADGDIDLFTYNGSFIVNVPNNSSTDYIQLRWDEGEKGLIFDADSIAIYDVTQARGLKYAGDYSTNGISTYGDRWIPDKGAVDTWIAAASGGHEVGDSVNILWSAVFEDTTFYVYGLGSGNAIDSINFQVDARLGGFRVRSDSIEMARLNGFIEGEAGDSIRVAIYADVTGFDDGGSTTILTEFGVGVNSGEVNVTSFTTARAYHNEWVWMEIEWVGNRPKFCLLQLDYLKE